jgi:hypothetical protein
MELVYNVLIKQVEGTVADFPPTFVESLSGYLLFQLKVPLESYWCVVPEGGIFSTPYNSPARR